MCTIICLYFLRFTKRCVTAKQYFDTVQKSMHPQNFLGLLYSWLQLLFKGLKRFQQYLTNTEKLE